MMPKWITRNRYLLIFLGVIIIVFLSLPVVTFNDPNCTILEDASGELLAARISPDGQWRFPDCDSVPDRLNRCIRLYEDQYLQWHPGINPFAL